MLSILIMATIVLCQSGGPLSPMTEGKLIVKTSWYGEECQGREMAYGGSFDKNNPKIAASKTLPPGTKLKLLDPLTGKKIQVQILDHGPNVAGRDLDISEAAAEKLGMKEEGVKLLFAWVVD